ncbi:DNRLRE domain-containing protein [Longitalea arenae]|uniref:DNRLRE domain-containing protein n=1 Tax=Longitalea arenae TaxID=2812558 RepID=UPI0019678E3D|nr:DNRLRE domain-containing protein [Longitalea arenae]
MKKNVTLPLALICIMVMDGFSQNNSNSKELVFQPGAKDGKDAWVQYVEGLPVHAARNFGDVDQLIAESWTFYGLGGTTGQIRGLLDFTGLHQIPQGTKVNYAYLSLYGVPTSSANDRGNQGANACYLQRITSPWQEHTVSWNNQPGITPANQVTIPASGEVVWNYHVIDLNITRLVQDIINLPPAKRYGFCIRLQNNNYYRSMLFASSDHADSTRHPKLRISLSDEKPLTAAGIAALTPARTGTMKQGISAVSKADLDAHQLNIVYALVKDGKTTLEILSSKGKLLRSYKLEGTKGRHVFTTELDADILKETTATLKITQGKTAILLPFLDE